MTYPRKYQADTLTFKQRRFVHFEAVKTAKTGDVCQVCIGFETAVQGCDFCKNTGFIKLINVETP